MSDSKEKYEPKPIKSVLKDIIAQKPLKKGVQQIKICNAWGETMGDHILSYTNEVRFSHNTLYVTLHSASLKMELSYGLDSLVKRINDHLGDELVRKITLI
tara:strand:- start:248 stop:550 length:303 start_codon:yes stop_codon:yes gene_type:complete